MLKMKPFDVTKGEQTILTGYFGAVIAIVGNLFLIYIAPSLGISREAALALGFLPLWGIIAFFDYYIYNRHEVVQFKDYLRGKDHLLRSAISRWLANCLVLVLFFFAYETLVIYIGAWYSFFKDLFGILFFVWLILGLPYTLITLKYRPGISWDRHDLSIFVLILIRRLRRFLSTKRYNHTIPASRLFWHVKNNRTILLGLLVKGFFLPLMTVFYYHNATHSFDKLEALSFLLATDEGTIFSYKAANLIYGILLSTLFLVDAFLAALGYGITSRFLNNGIRSVEQTCLGVLSCILCYPPWLIVSNNYTAWPSQHLVDLPDSPLKLIIMFIVLALFTIYVWATLAFGLKFSNLTNRGIFTQGPYRFCRHPAYAAKSISWWLEFLPSFTDPRSIFFMLCWNIVYIVRAYTEERHLSQDEHYQIYQKHVKYKFIPGFY